MLLELDATARLLFPRVLLNFLAELLRPPLAVQHQSGETHFPSFSSRMRFIVDAISFSDVDARYQFRLLNAVSKRKQTMQKKKFAI